MVAARVRRSASSCLVAHPLGELYLLAFGGFLVMLVSALTFERNPRKLGKAGLEQITQSMQAAGLRDAFGSTSSPHARALPQRDDE